MDDEEFEIEQQIKRLEEQKKRMAAAKTSSKRNTEEDEKEKILRQIEERKKSASLKKEGSPSKGSSVRSPPSSAKTSSSSSVGRSSATSAVETEVETLRRQLAEMEAKLAETRVTPSKVREEELRAEVEELRRRSETSSTRERLALEKEREELLKKVKERKEAIVAPTETSSPTIIALKAEKERLMKEISSSRSMTALTSEREAELTRYRQVAFGVDLCFLMDCTGSMSPWIQQATAKISDIMDAAAKIDTRAITRVAFAGYRDIGDGSQRFDIVDFTERSEIDTIRARLQQVRASGGADGPEDIAGGLDQALKLSWKASTRLLIHIADAPCHGRQYHSMGDDYPSGDPEGKVPENLLRKFCDRSVDFYFCKINNSTDQMIAIFKRVYEDANRAFTVRDIGSNINEFLPAVVNSVKASMSRSLAFARK
eukprot:TRINITY_DN16918_c0_g1_i1.p1 TRINITY_DN16918_c0_g1~~TRINITY_DN16918_c0_g1_i1.p1  ORF type:complete len:428 (-),score=111.64 TRINITY_DN16918_c0_g1_i1:78-1361(-)